MDKSNLAFALITVILGLYIAAALALSRFRGSERHHPAQTSRRRGRPWT